MSSPYVDGRAGIVYICAFITETSFLRNILNTSSSVLLGFKTTRRSRVVLDPIKHVLRVFFNGFKSIPGKACVKRVHNNDAFVNVGN